MQSLIVDPLILLLELLGHIAQPAAPSGAWPSGPKWLTSHSQSSTDVELGGLLEFGPHCWQPPDVEPYSFAGQSVLTHNDSFDAPMDAVDLPDEQLKGR